MREPRTVRVASARRGLAALLALLATACATGCDFSFHSKDDRGDGHGIVHFDASGSALRSPAIALDPALLAGPLRVRRDGEIVLRFEGTPDPVSARGAVRVVDETRGDAPVPVDVEVAGNEVRLRPSAPRGFRPGARLAVTVAGLPSLRALRGREGGTLREDARLTVDVAGRRRDDPLPPRLAGSEPPDGARAADPAAEVLLRFSERMDPLSFAAPGALRILAGGREVSFRVVLDRRREVATLIPEGGLPPGVSVRVELGPAVADVAGNPLAADSPRAVAFDTAEEDVAGPAAPVAWVFEEFEGDACLDRRGTTVPWADPASPGVLVGLAAALPLEVRSGPRGHPFALDPRGGRIQVLLPAEDLGEEPRALTAVVLLGAPDAWRGEVLDPEVRLGPAAGTPGPEGDLNFLAPPVLVAEGPRAVAARGPEHEFALPFRRPYAYDGRTDLLLEVSFAGVAGGGVVLQGSGAGGPRSVVLGRVAPAGAVHAGAPDLRVVGVGERAVARSNWIDSGADAPSWGVPRLRPPAYRAPPLVELQGAPAREDGRGPDPDRRSRWTTNPAEIEGMRWVRFRVLFEFPNPVSPDVVDDLAIPFSPRW